MGPEATAAILGALAGGGIASFGQWSTEWIRGRRDRRVAAQLIFGELVIGYGEASTAVLVNQWPSPSGTARRAAWEAYGRYVMPRRGVDGVGVIAMAYSSLDNIAWLASNGHIDPDEDYSSHLAQIGEGLAVLSRKAGMPKGEWERREAFSIAESAAGAQELRDLRATVDAQLRATEANDDET